MLKCTVCGKNYKVCGCYANPYKLLENKYKQAVADLKHADNCDICKHNINQDCDLECEVCKNECMCRKCYNEDKWEWRGKKDV